MRTTWSDEGGSKAVIFAAVDDRHRFCAPVADIRKTLTPQLKIEDGVETEELVLIDLGKQKHRLGGSILTQAYNSVGEHAPDIDAATLKKFVAGIAALKQEGLLLAYHEVRSDGGLLAPQVRKWHLHRAAVSPSNSTRSATTT